MTSALFYIVCIFRSLLSLLFFKLFTRKLYLVFYSTFLCFSLLNLFQFSIRLYLLIYSISTQRNFQHVCNCFLYYIRTLQTHSDSAYIQQQFLFLFLNLSAINAILNQLLLHYFLALFRSVCFISAKIVFRVFIFFFISIPEYLNYL